MEQVLRYMLPLVALAVIGIQQILMKKISDFPQGKTRREKNYLLMQKVALVVCSVYLFLRYDSSAIFAEWKIICILGLLLLIAYIDYKLQIIPNEILAVAVLIRSIIFLLELVQGVSIAIQSLVFELIACVVMLFLCIILRIISRKGVGMGDIKLLAILPLFLGIVGCFEVTLYSMIIIFLQACVCLISRKKGKKDVLPFAPAILGGTVIWIICLAL